ncbi:hypothetical protein LJC74_00045 [Eubacteriales bacterium OttesenSCG-928-A19]|nr:hypothetical protein [Eubacteriales bacterium OttesenSCG-928-A19]
MMNDDMLRNIEYLREKADVSYEEASTLLERYDGNVMRVLVELERQGRIYAQDGYGQTTQKRSTAGQQKSDAREKATGFINKAFQHHVVVESGSGESKKTVADLSAPYVAGAAIIAPHLAAASVALMFISGYRVRIRKEKDKQVPGDVETFVDQTVSNIKKTASSFTETVRGEKPEQPGQDDDNEGGEITVE